MLFSVLCLLAWPLLAWANTETIRFILESAPDTPSVEISGIIKDHLLYSTRPQYNHPQIEWFEIDHDHNKVGGFYELRVCWPASSPTAFSLIYENGLMGINYTTDYYTQYKALITSPSPVEFDIVINKIILKGWPRDITETMILAVCAGVVGKFLAPKVLNYMLI